MKTISIRPDTPIKRYQMVVSVLLLLFTVSAPHIGFSFAAVNFVFFLIWCSLHKEKAGRRFWLRMLFGIILCNAVVLLYIGFGEGLSAENTGDYRETLKTGILMKNTMPAFLDALWKNIRTEGSTYVPALFIAPFLTLFGGSFPVYILLLLNLFLVPFFILMGLILYKISPKSVPLVFLFVPFLKPVLCGSLDAAGLLYMAIWMYLIFNQTFRKRTTIKAVLLGILSFLLVLIRRWCLPFVLGAIFSMVISLCVRRLFDKKYRLKERLINLGITAAVFFCLVILFLPSAVTDVLKSLAEQSAGRIWRNIKMIFGYAGMLPLLFSFLGIMGLWRRHFRQFTLFLLFQLAITFLLCPAITAPGQAYLFAPQLFLLAVIGVSSLPKWKKTALCMLYAAFCTGFLYGFLK